jgi:hypothetical protein
MAYTQTQVDELTEAIASGVLSVRQTDGRMVTYQSLDQMRKLRQEMIDEIEHAAGTRRRRTFRAYQRGRGL